MTYLKNLKKFLKYLITYTSMLTFDTAGNLVGRGVREEAVQRHLLAQNAI